MLDKFSSEKKKQVMYIGAAVVGIVATMILLTSTFKENRPAGAEIAKPNIKVIDKKDTDAKVFRKEYGDELAALQAQIDSMKKDGANSGSQDGGVIKIQAPASNQNAPLPNSQSNGLSSLLVPPPPPASTMPMNPPTQTSPSQEPTKIEPPKSVIMGDMIGMVSTPVSAKEESSSGASAGNSKKQQNKKIELPSGSFMSGVLLNGLDAPTGGKAKSSPHPVLIRVTNTAKLPNRFSANLKECMIVGSGYGDLSSERAYVRLEKLSCMTEDGRSIEKSGGSSFGYVTGEDGKVGLLGRVVSKQGAILARTLAAGFLEGVSRSFANSSMTFAVQPTGTVATPDPGETLQTGLFGGAGEASKKLADFYMKLANEMFPVVEVSAGRKIDIILLEKLSFEIDGGKQ